ncbi:phosphotransferase [Phenylobacterium sp.]|uniref:phosphotransferase n=1 Tax=Phenylobacterium sp. TaxID=1871053 RepID=UPI0035AF1F81
MSRKPPGAGRCAVVAAAGKVLAAAREALRSIDPDAAAMEWMGPPLVSAQSVIYVLGLRHEPPRYVVKVMAASGGALSAAAQFAALRTCHDWWQGEDRHAVPRPVALLPGGDGLVLEHVRGESAARILSRVLARPGAALAAAGAAGDFLGRLHRHGEAGVGQVRLADLVAEIRASEAADLAPIGLALPSAVHRSLDRAPAITISVRRVRLHGDFTPRNVLVTAPAQVAVIDPTLQVTGLAEDDPAAFLTLMSSAPVFAGGLVLPPLGAARRRLEATFLAGYGPDGLSPVVLPLRLIYEQMWRWAYRRRPGAARRAGALADLRARLIDAQMSALLEESAGLLDRALAAAAAGEGRRRRRAPA